ncbi:MAG: zinc ribbon domain-containing protein [Bacteroidaceae bacterium]|nr:zinc ribbon domain-containing protein [Bacteroidaceae bacterium]
MKNVKCCPHCGEPTVEHHKFCVKCGAPLDTKAALRENVEISVNADINVSPQMSTLSFVMRPVLIVLWGILVCMMNYGKGEIYEYRFAISVAFTLPLAALSMFLAIPERKSNSGNKFGIISSVVILVVCTLLGLYGKNHEPSSWDAVNVQIDLWIFAMYFTPVLALLAYSIGQKRRGPVAVIILYVAMIVAEGIFMIIFSEENTTSDSLLMQRYASYSIYFSMPFLIIASSLLSRRRYHIDLPAYETIKIAAYSYAIILMLNLVGGYYVFYNTFHWFKNGYIYRPDPSTLQTMILFFVPILFLMAATSQPKNAIRKENVKKRWYDIVCPVIVAILLFISLKAVDWGKDLGDGIGTYLLFFTIPVALLLLQLWNGRPERSVSRQEALAIHPFTEEYLKSRRKKRIVISVVLALIILLPLVFGFFTGAFDPPADLTMFDLKGPVKEVYDEKYVYFYDENARLHGIVTDRQHKEIISYEEYPDGKVLFGEALQRDRKGRILWIGFNADDPGKSGIAYVYKNGKLKVYDHKGEGRFTIVKRNSKGLPEVIVQGLDDPEDEYLYVMKYTYEEFDEHGNWIRANIDNGFKEKSELGEGSWEDILLDHYYDVERVIKYYEE